MVKCKMMLTPWFCYSLNYFFVGMNRIPVKTCFLFMTNITFIPSLDCTQEMSIVEVSIMQFARDKANLLTCLKDSVLHY